MIKTLISGALGCALSASAACAMSSTTPITSDRLQQAAKNAAAVATIFACDVTTVANIALAVEQAVNSGGQVVRTGTTTKVVNVSTTLCSTLGGVRSTLAVMPAPAGN